ncbi:hypothetical protein Bbelb_050210 [Branchiostoma belcheri]|nr:hypothetical protein Bbelb_050210 [Branchiostoma belcheri]
MGEEAFWTYVEEKIGPQYATMQQHAGVPGTSSGHQAREFGHAARDCEEAMAFHVDSLQRFLKAACPSAATGVLTAIKKHGGCRSIKTIFENDKHESGSRVKTGSDPSVKNKSAYIEDVRLDCPASLKLRDIIIIDAGRKQHDANEPRVVVVMEKAPTGRQQKEESRRPEKFMRFREDHVYEEMDPDDVMERLKTLGEYEEEEDITEMLRDLNGPPRTTIELPLQDGQAYSVVVTTRARTVPMHYDAERFDDIENVYRSRRRREEKDEEAQREGQREG